MPEAHEMVTGRGVEPGTLGKRITSITSVEILSYPTGKTGLICNEDRITSHYILGPSSLHH